MRDDARIRVSVGPRPATAKDFCWQFTHSVRGCVRARVCGERGKYNQQKRRHSPGGWRAIIIIIVTHFTAMVGTGVYACESRAHSRHHGNECLYSTFEHTFSRIYYMNHALLH